MNSDELREFVVQRAGERCEYCLMPQKASTIPYQIDHIISKQHGGTNDDSNLALCCPICNRYKGPNVATLEPETGKFVGFFNPRKEKWNKHFLFQDGFIKGLSSEGRATEIIFRFNESVRVVERLRLVKLGLYTPDS